MLFCIFYTWLGVSQTLEDYQSPLWHQSWFSVLWRLACFQICSNASISHLLPLCSPPNPDGGTQRKGLPPSRSWFLGVNWSDVNLVEPLNHPLYFKITVYKNIISRTVNLSAFRCSSTCQGRPSLQRTMREGLRLPLLLARPKMSQWYWRMCKLQILDSTLVTLTTFLMWRGQLRPISKWLFSVSWP